jgi:hypothetical protein
LSSETLSFPKIWKSCNVSTLSSFKIIFGIYFYLNSGRGSVVGWGTLLQARRSRVLFPMRLLDSSINLILPSALWPWVRLSLSQKWVPGICVG